MVMTEEDENKLRKQQFAASVADLSPTGKTRFATTATERENTEEQRTIAAILITIQIVFCRLFSTIYEATTAI